MTHNTTKKRLGLAVPIEIYDWLLSQSERKGTSINGTCLELFWKEYEANKDAKPFDGKSSS